MAVFSFAPPGQDQEWQPRVDVYQTNWGWILKFDLAGVRLEDVHVHVSKRAVTVSGIRRDYMVEEAVATTRWRSPTAGSARSVELPDDLTGARCALITATAFCLCAFARERRRGKQMSEETVKITAGSAIKEYGSVSVPADAVVGGPQFFACRRAGCARDGGEGNRPGCAEDSSVENPGQDDLYTVGTKAVIRKMSRPNENLMEVLVMGTERVVVVRVDQRRWLPEGQDSAIAAARRWRSRGRGADAGDCRAGQQGGRTCAAAGSARTRADAGRRRRSAADVFPARFDAEPGDCQGAGAARSGNARRCAAPDARVPEPRGSGAGAEIEDRQHRAHRDVEGAARLPAAAADARDPAGAGREESGTGRSGPAARAAWRRPTCRTRFARKWSASSAGWRSCRSASPEHNVIRSYIELVLELPWNKFTEDNLDIAHARQVLDDDHFGLKEVKERILEHLGVLKMNPNAKAPILCLVGPPGVGKTSLGQSIARALGRNFERMSLGGMHDEAELRGHRRTYIGAMPGRLIQAIRRAKAKNPVLMLDEIDKLGRDYRGDPAAALLEILDPEQNKTFRDNYLDLPWDLSKVLFITTANTLDTIPRPLLDRMEILRLSGYTEEEKIEIAKQYLIPRQLKESGLTAEQAVIPDETLRALIQGYTREAGLRRLERAIGRLTRKVALRFAEGNTEPVDDPAGRSGRDARTGTVYAGRRCARVPARAWLRAWHGPKPVATFCTSKPRCCRTARD